MEFKQYPSYKNSGVEWLGHVPEHWNTKPTKYCFKLITDKAIENNSEVLLSVYTDIGVKPRSELEERGNKASTTDGYWIVKKGDIIVNKLLAWMGAIGLSNYSGVTSPAYDILRIKYNYTPEYYNYLFRNGDMFTEFKRYSRGLMDMRLRLYFSEFGNIKLPVPSIDEQQKIVSFLDIETARIDNLIAKQEKLIELLEEQRKSIISHAVTKGLNPNAPMKESGVEWLGEVPEHWKIGKLKRWFNTVSGGTPNSNNYAKYYKNGTHPWLRTTDLNNGILTSFEIGITDEAIKESSCKYVPEDSVLIAMYGGDGTIGKNALLKFKSTINQAICALIPNSHFNPEYTFFYIQFYRPYWMVNAMGGRKDPNINQQQIQDAYFVLPPFDEQNKIVDFLKKEHSRIDSLVLKQNQLIEKMKEYRSSIISHAVTGKINVREWVA